MNALDRLEALVSALGGKSIDLATIRKLEREGFKTIGSGATRIVVAIDKDRVAKIETDDGGSNHAELSIWEELGGKTDLLLPVLDERANGRILVMSRVKPFTGPADSRGRVKGVPAKLRRKLDTAKEELSEMIGRVYDAGEDPRYDFNWGLLGTRLVCFDYSS